MFWLAASKVSDHRIPPKETVTESYDVQVPADAAGPLKVAARLRYRAASPSLLRLALGADSKAELPIVEMTRIHYERLMERGLGDDDISALFVLKHELFPTGNG